MTLVPIQKELVRFTENDLQRAFVETWMWARNRYAFIAPNVRDLWPNLTEYDLLAIRRSGFVDEIEIKLSASDFAADFKKMGRHGISKHKLIAEGGATCNYFAFLVPEELESKIKVPDHAGLYVLRRGHFAEEAKRAPRLHKNRIGEKMRGRLGEKMMFKYWRHVIK